MSKLKTIEKTKLERFLEMGGGYVCNFSNRTFKEFVSETTGKDIYDDKYMLFGDSKANRLRAFWKIESDQLVTKMLDELLEYWKDQLTDLSLYSHGSFDSALYGECRKIVSDLRSAQTVDDITVFSSLTEERDTKRLSELIQESIENNSAEEALDRLHTLVVKYFREICKRHNIQYEKETPIHSLVGSYIKFLRQNNFIESQMSERILKSSISTFEAFNSVRNDHSFAHDNPILNSNESILIVKYVCSTIHYIEIIELKILEHKKKSTKKVTWDDIPYAEEEIEAASDKWIQQQLDQAREK